MPPRLEVSIKKVGYGSSNRTLSLDTHFTLSTGEILGLKGGIGTGKSTICKIVSGIIPFEEHANIEGDVAWNFYDKSISLGSISSANDIHKRIAYVSQNPEKNIVCDYVYDELLFNLEMQGFNRNETIDIIRQSIYDFEIQHLVNRKTSELSGGEKQLISIVANLMSSPEMIILDEPTAQLDSYWSRYVGECLVKIAKSRDTCILISSHKQQFLSKYSDSIVSFKDNNIETSISLKPKYKSHESFDSNNNDTAIKLDNLAFNRNGTAIFSMINAEIMHGDSILLIGRNGVGKSTLLDLISGFEEPNSGNIYLSPSVKSGKFPRNLQYVFQNPDHHIFTSSIQEELMIGLSNGTYNHQEIAISKKRFCNFLASHQISKEVDPRQLSWGQKKILNITIAFCLLENGKSLIMLDEPDLALDKDHVDVLKNLFINARVAGVTILIVSHNWNLYKGIVNRVLMMESDSMIEIQDWDEIEDRIS